MNNNLAKLHIIYIPGLGDSRAQGQHLAVNFWHWFGVESEVLRMRWDEDEPWEVKLQRLLDRIDELHADNQQVALVGSSAGAIPVIVAYTSRKYVTGCVVIAGKVNHPETIGKRYSSRNPALLDAAYDCERSLRTLTASNRQRIQSRYALFDGVVSRHDSHIDGARNRLLLSFGHIFTIATQLTIGVTVWLPFLRRLHNEEKGIK